MEKEISRSGRKQFSLNINAGILTLAIGGFTIGMTEFMMMGVLPDIAGALGISIPAAGHLISIYALGVVIGAPLMTAFSVMFPPKKILMLMMLLFMVFNTLFSLAPNFELLLVARLFAGLPHGAFFGMGAVVASKLAQPGKEARAVSVMFSGLTVANIIGVPLGTLIGHNLSWRVSFLLVAAIALLAALSMKKWMPEIPPASKQKFLEGFKIFKKTELWLIILITAIGTGGLFAWISYIAPLMTETAGFSANAVAVIMIIAGLGMAMGNIAGGRMADRYAPLKTTAILLFTMAIILVVVALVSFFKPAAIVMTFITGAVAFGLAAPLQMLMIKTAKGAEMLASSVIQASFNIGNALGAYLGGLPIAAGLGYTSPEYAGAILAFTGFLFCLVLFRKTKQSRTKAIASIKTITLSGINILSQKNKEHENTIH